MKPLRIVFAGTPDFACPSLDALCAAGHDVVLVVTQPDRPCGRGRRIMAPAVKDRACSLTVPIEQPVTIDETHFRIRMETIDPDLVVVVAFGQKIPSWFLRLPRLGCVNVHASLLPKYRGAAPIQRALMDGLTETGVTIMLLDEGWDTGPILSQRPVAVAPDDNAGTLHDRLAKAGAELLAATVGELAAGRIRPRPQDDTLATRAPKVRPEEMRIDWTADAARLHDLVRALAPVPLAETFHGGRRLQIAEAVPLEGGSASPGTVLAVEQEEVVVQAGRGALRLLQVKPANSRLMPAAAYARGHGLKVGTVLG